jgi:hypothetical protein
MEFRCQNCGHRIVLNTPPTAAEVACPSCGAVTKPPGPPTSGRLPEDVDLARPDERTLRRIFEPIPRPFTFLVGGLIVLAILAPFWVYLLKERVVHRAPLLSDDASSISVPPPVETNATPPVREEPPMESTNKIDEFQGIRLNSNREELQRRFNLLLQNTRGMVPEIYEAGRDGDVNNVVLHFYNNSLKEFWVEMRERRVVPDQIEKELREQFGEPRERTVRSSGQSDVGLGSSLSNATGIGNAGSDRERKLAEFPYRVTFTWLDDETLIEATIYYTSVRPALCSSVLTLHATAARWLDNNRPRISSVVAPAPAAAASVLEKTNEAVETAVAPRKLFP